MIAILKGLYQSRKKKSNSNRRATRKTLHFIQRTIIDRIQRIYYINGVSVNIQHLELVVRQIAMVQIIGIKHYKHKNNVSTTNNVVKEKFFLEEVEGINWNYAIKNWRKK